MKVQIRTREIHHIAEEGIAAHWSYKEKKPFKEKDAQRFAWLRQLVDLQKELKTPEGLPGGLRRVVSPAGVSVFPPQGEAKEVPRGAPPVDFPDPIHSEVGNACTG